MPLTIQFSSTVTMTLYEHLGRATITVDVGCDEVGLGWTDALAVLRCRHPDFRLSEDSADCGTLETYTATWQASYLN